MDLKKLKYIILDRDGVINYDSDDYIKTTDEWIEIPGSLEAISRLNKFGLDVAIASNQSGIGRGYFTLETLNQMHNKMKQNLMNHGGKIKQIEFCVHLPEDDCQCRKPKPGMLNRIISQNKWHKKNGLFIGDSITDKMAAKACGVPFFLVKTGKGTKTFSQYPDEFVMNKVFENLSSCIDFILQRT